MGLFGNREKSSWIVVFLGNPGEKYAGTRHNVGFMTADACEAETGVRIIRSKFQALTASTKVAGVDVFLMKPQTYMNLSGNALREAVHFYKVPPERVIVVSDDVSLPIGKLRIRTKGSAGGHNGLKSIIENLQSDAFPRVKVGIGAPPGGDLIDWVIGEFHGTERDEIKKATERAWEAVKCYIEQGPEKAMNKFN